MLSAGCCMHLGEMSPIPEPCPICAGESGFRLWGLHSFPTARAAALAGGTSCALGMEGKHVTVLGAPACELARGPALGP